MITRWWLRATTLWFFILLFAFANGTARELLYGPLLGDTAAHATSSVLAVSFICIVSYAGYGRGANHSQASLWAVGIYWLALTLVFEFGFFHYVAGVPWSKLLAEYNVFAGRLWPFVLLAALVAPRFVGRTHESQREGIDNESA